ncbi:MAG: hydroxyectoine utilization dehydratase EutB [Bacillota bacterium]
MDYNQGSLMASTQLQRLDIKQIWEARNRISPLVKETPFVFSPSVSKQHRASVFLKLETAHETGAFKIRGAANKILSLTPMEQQKGVVTFSTGNHGIAVSYIARKLGITVVVCISQRVPEAKINLLRNMGAKVEIVGNNQDEAEEYCYELGRVKGLTVIKPFDDPHIIAGQGTIGLEILEQCPKLDVAIVPVSGGGLFSGVAFTLKNYLPGIKMIGVSMEKSAVMYNSLKARTPVTMLEESTLADSLLGGIGLDNQYTYSLVSKYLDDFVLVSEEEIAQGMAHIFKNHKIVVEGAAATGVAALLHKVKVESGSNVAVLVTGNNVDMGVFSEVIKKWS